ncbi:hypothetical protein EON66_07185 [archaeon]|nr:MAG: hypothetical protein EON66_07185 [archaeon]
MQNGSNIMKWWIHHHYMSAVLSLVLLTWPTDSDTWHRFHPVFTAYFLYQGLVQLMQARYQKSRHYALTALGKVSFARVHPPPRARSRALARAHVRLHSSQHAAASLTTHARVCVCVRVCAGQEH